MAPVLKKCRRIGSMLDNEAEDTSENVQAEIESSDDDLESDSNSDNSNTSGSDTSDEDEGNDSANNQAEKRTRGHGKQGFEWGTGKVLLLSLDVKNRVIGSNAALFSSQLGILAKDGNKLPLTYTDWRAVPQIQKDMAWEEIKENTNLTDSYKKNCLKKLGRLWKDWKNRVKARHFKPDRHNKSALLSKRPDRVEASQWPILVNYWLSDKAKAISKKNKSSRKKIKLHVRIGRRDMANVEDDLRQEHGKEPSKSHVFVYSRQGKSGTKLDVETEEKIARILQMQQQLPDHLKDDIDANNEIYETVVGKEAPGCLSSYKDPSKGKNVMFTSREDFDEAVRQKASAEVAGIEKKFEDELAKFKNECYSRIEMLQAQFNTENPNVHVPGSSNSRRILAPNNVSSPQEINASETSQANENIEMSFEKTIPVENNTNTVLCGTSSKTKDKKGEPTRRSKRKTT